MNSLSLQMIISCPQRLRILITSIYNLYLITCIYFLCLITCIDSQYYLPVLQANRRTGWRRETVSDTCHPASTKDAGHSTQTERPHTRANTDTEANIASQSASQPASRPASWHLIVCCSPAHSGSSSCLSAQFLLLSPHNPLEQTTSGLLSPQTDDVWDVTGHPMVTIHPTTH